MRLTVEFRGYPDLVRTFVVTLHVLAVVLMAGPFALLPFAGARAIQRRESDSTRLAAMQTGLFGLGTLLAALFGFGAVSTGDKYSFHTPWIIISMTLVALALIIAGVYTVPALRKAADMIEEGVLAPAVPDPEESPAPSQLTASAAQMIAKERLDAIFGRVAGSGGLILLCIAAVTVLMAAKPFGP